MNTLGPPSPGAPPTLFDNRELNEEGRHPPLSTAKAGVGVNFPQQEGPMGSLGTVVMMNSVRIPRWVYWLLALLPLVLVTTAHGGGNTIPDRQNALCTRLGLPPECTLTFESGKRVKGLLTLAISEWVGPTSVLPWLSGVHASMVLFQPMDSAPIAQIWANNEGPDVNELQWYLQQNVCLTLDCESKRADQPDYGVSKYQLTEIATVLNHLWYQTPEDALVHELQMRAGATGIPVITRVETLTAHKLGRLVNDQQGRALASAFGPVKVSFQFVVVP